MRNFGWIILAFAMGITTNVHSQQNLVPNPSFEDTIGCPDGTGGIEVAIGWYSSGGTPDYFNSCANANTTYLGVPSNFVGKQLAFDGNGYAGLGAWSTASPSREFMGIQLSQSMTTGVEYFISARVSLSDSIDSYSYTCSCNNLGFKFSTVSYDYINSAPINNYSHVYSNSIIDDTLNWIRIFGSFIADSNYQYLTIGNFFDNANTDTIECSYSSLAAAYYYIDAVCVSTDSLSCLQWTGVKEKSILSKGFNVYPNPCSGLINLMNIESNENLEYYLFKITGECVLHNKINNHSNQINITGIPSGTYILQIETSYLKIIILD